MTSAASLIQTLRSELEHCLDPMIPAGQVALLDFPNHANVGDSAIWLGEIAYLRARKCDISYHCEVRDYSETALRSALPEGVILLHGGGNFGDIWPAHQRFREHILERFRDHKIVQFPQSIHFSDPSEIDKTARLIAAHGRFTLLVRDHASLEFARRHFDCETRLSPDMAFYMPPLRRAGAPVQPFVALMRTDKEKRAFDGVDAETAARFEDWLEEDGRSVTFSRRRAALGQILRGHMGSKRRFAGYHAMAMHRLKRGVHQLSRGRRVVTDRLHGHILCTLLDIPHAILDNSYGKLTGFHGAWTSAYSGVHAAATLPEAIAWARAGGVHG